MPSRMAFGSNGLAVIAETSSMETCRLETLLAQARHRRQSWRHYRFDMETHRLRQPCARLACTAALSATGLGAKWKAKQNNAPVTRLPRNRKRGRIAAPGLTGVAGLKFRIELPLVTRNFRSAAPSIGARLRPPLYGCHLTTVFNPFPA